MRYLPQKNSNRDFTHLALGKDGYIFGGVCI